MHLLAVVPFARLPRNAPQVFSYTHTETLPPGAMVRIAIGRRAANAIVLDAKPLAEHKGTIKRLSYQLKPINGVLSGDPLLLPWQIELARWAASHFYEPLSLVLRTFLPAIFEQRKTMPTIAPAADIPPPQQGSVTFTTAPLKERIEHYKTIIGERRSTLLLAPDQRIRNLLAEKLNLPIFDVSLKGSQLLRLWNDIRSANTTAVVGTRSALMAPFPQLRHLIVEQESSDHHASWDQHPKIDARRIADWLGAHETKVLMGDRFPTLERSLRYGIAPPQATTNPVAQLVDLRTAERDEKAPTLSYALANAIEKTIERHNRILLYVARRGIATFILCQDCGFHIECPHCSVPLVLHSDHDTETLRCHHCGHRQSPPSDCASCHSPNIRYAGIGTQTVENDLRRRFPDIPLLRLDADTIQKQQAITSFERGILLGTDLLLSHPQLPPVDLAAAVSIETLLHLPAYTATERLVRALLRIKERAQKQFIVQTYTPEALGVTALFNDAIKTFIASEDKNRRQRNYPPYAQLILCELRGASATDVNKQGQILRQRLEQQRQELDLEDAVELLGPAPAFIERTHDEARGHLFLKWKLHAPVFTLEKNDRILRKRLLDVIPPQWEITVDPVSLL